MFCPFIYILDYLKFIIESEELADKQAGNRKRFRVSSRFQLSESELDEKVFFLKHKQTGEIAGFGKEKRDMNNCYNTA